eukprot:scaffold2224_cov261-Pinguiococcus_pyrenoidosus.AAC.11
MTCHGVPRRRRAQLAWIPVRLMRSLHDHFTARRQRAPGAHRVVVAHKNLVDPHGTGGRAVETDSRESANRGERLVPNDLNALEEQVVAPPLPVDQDVDLVPTPRADGRESALCLSVEAAVPRKAAEVVPMPQVVLRPHPERDFVVAIRRVFDQSEE